VLNPVVAVKREIDTDTQYLEKRLCEYFSAPIQLNHTAKGKGDIRIHYNSLDELDGILKRLGLEQE